MERMIELRAAIRVAFILAINAKSQNSGHTGFWKFSSSVYENRKLQWNDPYSYVVVEAFKDVCRMFDVDPYANSGEILNWFFQTFEEFEDDADMDRDRLSVILATIDQAGIAYELTRQKPAVLCNFCPKKSDLVGRELAGVSYKEIDKLAACGYVRISPYGDCASVVLTYKGRKTYIEFNSKTFNLERWRKLNAKYLCCPEAIPSPCVCSCCTLCEKHGRNCNGSHD